MRLRLLAVWDLAVAFGRVLRDRWRNGAARPTWSFPFEWVCRFLLATEIRVNRFPVPVLRAFWEGANPPSLASLKTTRRAHPLGAIPATVVAPRRGAAARTVLYFHGGCYLYGSLRTHGDLVSRLALEANAKVVFVDYRMAPEHPFPAAFDDALEAYRRVLEQTPADRLLLAGDSAGGGLVAALLPAARASGLPMPAGAMLICPWVDLSARGGTLTAHQGLDWALAEHFVQWEKLYLGEASSKDPRASPLFADLSGLPPLLVLGGTAEMLLDQERAFVARCQAAGVEVDEHLAVDMVHNWMMLPTSGAPGREALRRLGSFAKARAPVREQ